MFIVVINALVMTSETYDQSADQIKSAADIEALFVAFFILEMCIKILGLGLRVCKFVTPLALSPLKNKELMFRLCW